MDGLNLEQRGFVEQVQISGLWSYLESIDWTEPWLQCLVGFEAFLLLVSILLRRWSNLQGLLFLASLAVVYAAEPLNKLAAQNWASFSRQQYFDSQGMFISIVLCGPLLVIDLVIIMFWVYESCQLLISLKRKQLGITSKAKKDS